jgi:hypothetical protein
MFKFLISRKTVAAFGTFAAAANRRSFTRGARINDLIVLTTAFWATHKTTANCGYMFVTHKILWCQGRVIHKNDHSRTCKNEKSVRLHVTFYSTRLLNRCLLPKPRLPSFDFRLLSSTRVCNKFNANKFIFLFYGNSR